MFNMYGFVRTIHIPKLENYYVFPKSVPVALLHRQKETDITNDQTVLRFLLRDTEQVFGETVALYEFIGEE